MWKTEEEKKTTILFAHNHNYKKSFRCGLLPPRASEKREKEQANEKRAMDNAVQHKSKWVGVRVGEKSKAAYGSRTIKYRMDYFCQYVGKSVSVWNWEKLNFDFDFDKPSFWQKYWE